MSQSYDLPTFLDTPGPVELVTALQDVARDGNSVYLTCETHRYDPQIHDYYGTRCETVFDPPTPAPPATIRLDFCTPAIVRMRYFPGPAVPDVPTPMVVGSFDAPVAVTLTEDATTVQLRTDALRIVVVREPWQIQVYDNDAILLWSTRPVDIAAFRRPAQQWNPPQQRWLFSHRYAYPLGVAREGDTPQVFASFSLHHDEHIYGFGESFGPFDKRGTYQRLWLVEGFGNASPGSYKRVPFWMSTRGYGVYVHTSNAVAFRVGELEHTALSVTIADTALLDCYVIYGPRLKDILPRYTAITGAPAVPPRWSFGLWMGRISYGSRAEVETVARDLRDHRIPCDVIHIDTDWFERDWECDWQFSRSKFPDPAGMLAALRAQGFRVCLWQWPIVPVHTDVYREARARGYLVRRRNGHPYTFSGFEADAGLIDYANPEAVAWIQAKFRALFDLGVAVIKADFGEGAPPDAIYRGVASAAMHNLYPLLYNQAAFECTRSYWGDGKALIWARSAWAGSQRYPVHWSGDGIARYEDLPCVLRAALSFGLSGFPFYSHDIGGFSGLPDPELYVRWAQFGLFSSHARCHGEPPREPWAYGAEAEAIFRQYAELRYRLLPYIYSEAVVCGQTSLPLVRALVVEYQDDPTTHTIDDQYLFGRSLLVAPIMDTDARRWVYLPRGTWFDYWTKAVVPGGQWIEVTATLQVVPLYVRGGALLPYGPVVQHTGEQRYDPLTVEIYAPETSEAYTIYDEDRSTIPLRYERAGEYLHVTLGAAPGQVELVLYGVRSRAAWLDGVPLDLETLPEDVPLARFDGGAERRVTFQLEM